MPGFQSKLTLSPISRPPNFSMPIDQRSLDIWMYCSLRDFWGTLEKLSNREKTMMEGNLSFCPLHWNTRSSPSRPSATGSFLSNTHKCFLAGSVAFISHS